MPRIIPVDKWRVYFQAKDDGHPTSVAARMAKISVDAAYRFEHGEPSSGRDAARALNRVEVGGRRLVDTIPPDARRALDDFPYFRIRYFGRASVPWQADAAYKVLAALETPDKEFLCINAPPGLGKSTLFTHDLILWLICRRRSIRILVGSRTGRQARLYVSRLRRSLERLDPMLADPEAQRISGAVDAVASLARDYGTFKPDGRGGRWTDTEFTVVQPGGNPSDDKENTVAAYGKDEAFFGGRYDLAIWDDLVDRKNTRDPTSLSDLVSWWQTEGETRIEPGGAMILQGQRMAPRDLYRWALDVRRADDTPKYTHVLYQAHNDAACTSRHDRTSKAWPHGCLLDPRRLSWTDCENIRRQDRSLWDIQYQQGDGTEQSALLHRLWLDGGSDSDGTYPGCYDRARRAGQVPALGTWSLVTVDPSPSNYWAIQWWVVDPERPTMSLVTAIRSKMSNLGFLTYDLDTHEFSGVLHTLWMESVEKGRPISQVVVETNAAQKWLLSQPYAQRWQMATGVTIYPHTTHMNKIDPQYGVQSVSQFFKQGAVRLPDADAAGRVQTRHLTDELLSWPRGATDDQVMALWFMVRHVQLQYAPTKAAAPAFSRPSWLGTVGRGLPTSLRTRR